MTNLHGNNSFAWDAVVDATAYDAEVQQGGAAIATANNLSFPTVAVAAFAGLTLLTAYNFRVRAKNSYGNGSWSALFAFQIVGPDAPQNIHVV